MGRGRAVVVSRRTFLKALGGAALAMSAGGIALLDAEPIVRTYFLPPRCGWNAGSMELAFATEALRIVNMKIDGFSVGLRVFGPPGIDPVPPLTMALEQGQYRIITSATQREVDSLLTRRARLVERVDKLARGWKGSHTERYLSNGGSVIVHGGRRV